MEKMDDRTKIGDLEEDLAMDPQFQAMVNPRLAGHVLGLNDRLTQEIKERIWQKIRKSRPELPENIH